MMDRQDLTAIKEIVTSAIQETVPDMIQEGIKATVPDIIDEKLQAGTEILLDVIEERAKETESVIIGRLEIIEKYYHLHRLETSIQDDHKRMIYKLQDEMKEVRARLGMA